MSRREEGIRVKSRSHPQPLPAEHTGHASWFKSTRMPQSDQQHTRACTGCVPIPTSNIRLLCLTYTFSPFIRLIRLFWKKWRREGKVRDTVVTGTNAMSHAVGMAAERKHAETSEHGRQTMTHHTLVWVVFFFFCGIFNFLPAPWALHLPPGPTGSIKKEREIKTYQAIFSKVNGSIHTGWLWALRYPCIQMQHLLKHKV